MHGISLANAALEKILKDNMQSNGNNTPGLPTPSAPSSSHSLTPSATPTDDIPSPLGNSGITTLPFPSREIPGFYVVITAGGAGTRLWPLSRKLP
ncbi:hypothetical protein BD410DRAFT_844325 [Rickenella mellea]|uniref:Nucleotidyl transferase domain-containing protein n=1 Tax=Rickenella mellea TaxID=50990 RepID=A0A4Y7PJI8_9AGAM|nr:hypothetical protein BD410DRAFT_845365 [Rickenella mellea]TDL16504.1 hypothetical protein BD410DRAFT_844325 [Rickenella mellea]